MVLSVLVVAGCLMFSDMKAWADVEWKILKQLRIKEKPLDVDVSLDGQNLYILVEGKLIVYSLTESKGKYSIPINKSFNTLKISEANQAIILSSTSENLIEIIQLFFIQNFDLSGSPFQGRSDAPVTICAFIDYQCQHCAGIMPLLQRVLDQYPDRVKIVFKNSPLGGEQLQLKAAAAAIAAHRQNKFWDYHHLLFANFDKLDEAKLQALAAEAGLDIQKFNFDVQSAEIQGIITRDIGEALQAQVSSIPAVFINGKKLEEPSFEGFQQMIDAELGKQNTPLPPTAK